MLIEMGVDEAWPEHAGHVIIYRVTGALSYELNGVLVDSEDADPESRWQVNEWDTDPWQSDIEHTEVYCASCNVVLLAITGEMPASEEAFYRALCAEYGLEPDGDYADEWNERLPFALVERNERGAPYYISLHTTASNAVHHHQSQEYAEDWSVERIVDCRDGQEWQVEMQAVVILKTV